MPVPLGVPEIVAAADVPGDGDGAPPPPRAPRGARGQKWPNDRSPWSIAPIFLSGIFSGYGATCGCHGDPEIRTACKKACMVASDEGRMRVKKWLLVGRDIAAADGRAEHIAVNARDLALPATEAELDAEAALIFGV